MISTRVLIAAGIALALVVGIGAVFFASSDPDGLDSTALVTQGQKELTQPANPGAAVDGAALPGTFEYSAPFAEYTLGGSKLADAGLMAAGTLLALIAVLGIGRGLKAFNRSRSS
ncbi:MAG TPA: cobalamin biosynthesis protein CbiN [Methanoregulaceae archaeon]|nr:cobalamin biosynthesis protein CbiN [Methanoregulaceae archaeon]